MENSLCVMNEAKSGKLIGGQVSPFRMCESLSSSRSGTLLFSKVDVRDSVVRSEIVDLRALTWVPNGFETDVWRSGAETSVLPDNELGSLVIVAEPDMFGHDSGDWLRFGSFCQRSAARLMRKSSSTRRRWLGSASLEGDRSLCVCSDADVRVEKTVHSWTLLQPRPAGLSPFAGFVALVVAHSPGQLGHFRPRPDSGVEGRKLTGHEPVRNDLRPWLR